MERAPFVRKKDDDEMTREARAKAEAAKDAAREANSAASHGYFEAVKISRPRYLFDRDSRLRFIQKGIFWNVEKAGRAAMEAAQAAFEIFDGGGRLTCSAWMAIGGARAAWVAARYAALECPAVDGWNGAYGAARESFRLIVEADEAVRVNPFLDKDVEKALDAAVGASNYFRSAFYYALQAPAPTSMTGDQLGGGGQKEG